ncbi:MAG: hypothetical protein PHR62_14465, partial [Paludibacter sp.]|nr:hypothetical protein [Paludibacter sp.]
MKKTFILSIAIAFTTIGFATKNSRSYIDFVNPLIGSQSDFALSNGNTYPAIARPWGMNFWVPQTAKMG